MQLLLVCLLGLVSLAAAAPIFAKATQDINEGGVPIHVENRSGEKVEITKSGNGVIVKIGDDPKEKTAKFKTPWGPVTLISNGKTDLNMNFSEHHINIIVGLASEEWTGETIDGQLK